jgi:hypothetical protein
MLYGMFSVSRVTDLYCLQKVFLRVLYALSRKRYGRQLMLWELPT